MERADELQLVERTLGGLHADLVEHLPPLQPDDAILDVGCGTGAWLDRLGRAGFSNLHGIDLDVSSFATRRASCTQANLDYDSLGLDGRMFKLITAIELVEHLENPGRLFWHVSRHLAPDGFLLVTTPNIHSLLCRLRYFLSGELKQFDDKGDPTHIYPVLLKAWERVLPRHGLRIVGKWPYPADGGTITSRPIMRMVAAAARLLARDDIPGDTLCLLVGRAAPLPGSPVA